MFRRPHRREARFMDDFYNLMSAAHFRVLTRQDWDMAMAHDFTVRPLMRSVTQNGGLPAHAACAGALLQDLAASVLLLRKVCCCRLVFQGVLDSIVLRIFWLLQLLDMATLLLAGLPK